MATIFLIDDEEIITEPLKLFLEENGHAVESYINARDALADLKKYKPDIIMVDIFMPHTGGFEFIKELRNRDDNVYVIAMTGGFDPFDPKSCLYVAERDGANIGIPKPLDYERVLQIIDNQKFTSPN